MDAEKLGFRKSFTGQTFTDTIVAATVNTALVNSDLIGIVIQKSILVESIEITFQKVNLGVPYLENWVALFNVGANSAPFATVGEETDNTPNSHRIVVNNFTTFKTINMFVPVGSRFFVNFQYARWEVGGVANDEYNVDVLVNYREVNGN